MIINFKTFLFEAATPKSNFTDEQAKVNAKGVLHELLVGKELNGGKHMNKHSDNSGMSPSETHDHFKKYFSDDEYDLIHSRAKSAANDIKKHLKGNNIKAVHWTSKPGDLEKSTGIPATQKQDSSDIVVTTHDPSHPSGVRHHGISLKVSDRTEKVSLSNHGFDNDPKINKMVDDHREKIKKDYPILASDEASNKPKRKAIVNANPEMKSDIRTRNKQLLHDISTHLHQKLSKLPKHKLLDHVKEILHAHTTPMQTHGHEHFRHSTWGTTNFKHSKVVPDEKYKHLDHNDLSIEHVGNGVKFKHKDEPFLHQSVKFNSQSDPMSSVLSNSKNAGKSTSEKTKGTKQ